MNLAEDRAIDAPRSSRGPEPTAEQSHRRLRSIDAVRGIAALVVVLGHSLEQALRTMPETSGVRSVLEAAVVDYLNLGRIGVVAFFILSGYVIPFSFAHAKPVRSFLIARFFRLYPAYWVSIAGAIFVTMLITGAPPTLPRVAVNLSMIQAILGQADLIGVYWTLFYELLFYGLCLFAFLIGRMESPRYLLMVVIALMLAGLTAAVLRRTGVAAGVPIGIPMFLGIMHLGTLARLSDRGDGPLATRCFRIGLVVVLLAAGPISGIGFIQHASSQRLFADVSSLYVGLALFLLLRRSPAICRPPLLFLGLISYALYLFHPLSLDPIVDLLAPQLDPAIRPLFILVSVPTSAIVVAVLVQRYVEAPANRYGRMLRHRLVGAA